MGACVSQPGHADKQRSDNIDGILEKDNEKFQYDCKVLILGSKASGKTTIFNQIRIMRDGFSHADLAEYRPVIYKNVLDSVNAIVVHMKQLGLECVELANRFLAAKIIDYHLNLQDSPPHVSTEIAEAIHQLLRDPAITKIIDEHSSEFHLMDSAPYFFSEILRIGAPDYLPTKDDVLHAHQENMGITETRVKMRGLSMHMIDINGQRSERKKWIHCFENVKSLIFCTALNEYDQVLLEEKYQNRMLESLALFDGVINSRWFRRASIMLFLNKTDMFKKKLPNAPLEQYFPEYSGGSDFDKATKYIMWKFVQTNRARLRVYPHLTQATAVINFKMVVKNMQETIMQNALVDSGNL